MDWFLYDRDLHDERVNLRLEAYLGFCQISMMELENLNETQAHSEPTQTSRMELFAKIFNGLKPLTIFGKRSTLDV